MKPYSIPFTGLKNGSHAFDFAVDDSFFAEFEYSLVKKGTLNCHVDLEKQETMMVLDFHISGEIWLSCDRCLSDFKYPVDVKEQQIAKFSGEDVDEGDDLIILAKNDTVIDISPIIYELVNISVPVVSVCGDEGNTPYCDKSMLEKLSNLSDGGGDDKTDPRWDALKNLK